tara:strand:- start:3471 stop:3848 length:378 start_codon:yes stop_codon:yes gene_type:complete
MIQFPEQYRVRGPKGGNGFFQIQRSRRTHLNIIASNGEGWEHVSVVAYKVDAKEYTAYTPTWAQMCFVKNLFWEPEDVVIQYHPARKDYINNHEHCLHLWRPIGQYIPTPDPILVGIKTNIKADS